MTTANATYTPEELAEFDRLTMRGSSRDQVTRIAGRMDVAKFETEHGKEKCRLMFEELKRRDAKKKIKGKS